MKSLIQRVLQSILGFRNYLFIFSIFKILTLRFDRKEGDFFGFLKLIKPGSVVLDIGANLGIMTVILSRKASKVIAFEPIPDNFQALQRVLRFFTISNTEIFSYALGSEKREDEMILPEIGKVRKQGLSHMSSVDPLQTGRRYKVKVKRLDDEITEKKIHAIKMDVENFEYEVLLGAQKILKRDRPMIYTELWDNQNRQNCFDLIRKFNYSIKVLDKKMLVDYDVLKHKHQNFFFIPG